MWVGGVTYVYRRPTIALGCKQSQWLRWYSMRSADVELIMHRNSLGSRRVYNPARSFVYHQAGWPINSKNNREYGKAVCLLAARFGSWKSSENGKTGRRCKYELQTKHFHFIFLFFFFVLFCFFSYANTIIPFNSALPLLRSETMNFCENFSCRRSTIHRSWSTISLTNNNDRFITWILYLIGLINELLSSFHLHFF